MPAERHKIEENQSFKIKYYILPPFNNKDNIKQSSFQSTYLNLQLWTQRWIRSEQNAYSRLLNLACSNSALISETYFAFLFHISSLQLAFILQLRQNKGIRKKEIKKETSRKTNWNKASSVWHSHKTSPSVQAFQN